MRTRGLPPEAPERLCSCRRMAQACEIPARGARSAVVLIARPARPRVTLLARRLASVLALGLALPAPAVAATPAADPATSAAAASPAATSAPPPSAPVPGRRATSAAPPRLSERTPVRRWALGIEGVALQIPPLRPRIVGLDARYLGNSVTTGGVGAVGRVRLRPQIALELAVRSGSLRYRSEGDLISQDLLLAELGALLFLARGDIGHFALDTGVGGLAHGIRYELAGGRTGAQLVGAFTVRVGADLELLLGRIALTFSLRAYGVVTDLARTRVRGALFEGATAAERQAPLPRYQTHLLGSAGLLYRF